MNYEVEKTIRMDKKEFDRVKKLLDTKAHKIDKFTTITYLFKKPRYVRIRYKTNSNKAIITQKKNVKKSLIREETEFEIQRKDINKFVKLLKNLGFKKCLNVKIKNITYTYEGLELKLSIGLLGNLLDIESVATNKKEFNAKLNKINSVIKEFHMDGESYMRFWNKKEEIVRKNMKPINKFKELK